EVGLAKNSFTINDGTDGVGVSLVAGAACPTLGDDVEVEGQTMTFRLAKSDYPHVQTNAVRVSGKGELPKPIKLSLPDLKTLKNYERWVSVEGYVIRWKFSPTTKELFIIIVNDGTYTTCAVRTDARPDWLDQLMRAKVRITGINAVVNLGDDIGALIAPSTAQLEILTPGSDSMFDAPLVSIQEVNARKSDPGMRVKVRAVVAAQNGYQFYLRGEGGAMMAALQYPWTRVPGSTDELADAGPWPMVSLGDEVEFVGSSSLNTVYALMYGDVRVIGKGRIEPPNKSSIEAIKAGNYKDNWVTLDARVFNWARIGNTTFYTVWGERDYWTIHVPTSATLAFPKNLHGAEVRFTGAALRGSGGIGFYIPDSASFQILTPGTEDPFDVPNFSGADIIADRVPKSAPVKFKGRVIGIAESQIIYLRTATEALRVKLLPPAPHDAGGTYADYGPPPALKMGDEVEVMGWTIREPSDSRLAHFDLISCSARILRSAEPPKPVTTTFTRIASGEHTHDLVEVRGRLLTIQVQPLGQGQWETTMLLKAAGTRMTAVHQSSVLHPFETLKANDDIFIQALVDRATSQTPRRLRLLSPTDAKSLGFSAELMALRVWGWGALAVFIFGILGGWVLLLRRSHRRQAQVTAKLKAANDAARESEQRWKLLFEQSPLSVQIFSPDGQTKRFNQAWKNLFRLNDEQGHGFNVLTDPDLNASGAVNLIRKAFEGEVVHVPPVPFPVNTEPPETRWIGGVLYPVKNEAGVIIEVVTIHNDITKQKQAEAAMLAINHTLEQRVNERTVELSLAKVEISRALDQERELSELKSRFVSMVSHEFRTPLGIIMSAIELMQHYDGRLTVEKRAELQMDIFSATRLMAGLMEQVLVLGRVEAGKLACKATSCELDILISKLTDECLSATNRRCPVTWCAENNLDGAQADDSLLRHIFGNLINNAVKYSPEGSEVLCTARREGDDAVFQVIDHGIGIPETDRARLFEAFHRCSNVGEIPGTGLGLVIVKRCVDLHEGTMQIDSTIGKGTTFTVRLPLFGK
ncbi:MAG: PAS domain-containing sensor histidine kinase, partial [Prosthecobacter sp.]